jgi:hypothetical protein
MNITGSPLAAHSSLLSHRYYLFFAISAFSLFSFKCMFDVILFCLLRTSEKFSDTPTLFDHQQGLDEDDNMGRGCRSCDAILFMVKKPPEAKYAVIFEHPVR